jgi:hypothetical protein
LWRTHKRKEKHSQFSAPTKAVARHLLSAELVARFGGFPQKPLHFLHFLQDCYKHHVGLALICYTVSQVEYSIF